MLSAAQRARISGICDIDVDAIAAFLRTNSMSQNVHEQCSTFGAREFRTHDTSVPKEARSTP